MTTEEKDARALLSNVKRIVIKIGTSSLVYKNGKVNFKRLDMLTRVISDLTNQGKEIILVSSGAIGLGVNKLKLKKKPDTVSGRQAVAAVGQCTMMQIYGNFFGDYDLHTAQLLLTRDVVEKDAMRVNAVNTFEELLKMGIVPIVNENDSVAVDEIKFGENDKLSAIISILASAGLLIILTDKDGYYDKNPNEFDDARLIHSISDLSEKVEAAAGGSGSKFGTGGMLTKVHASRLAAEKGIYSVIANGDDPRIIYEIIEGKDVGTIFFQN
ncbi:MAG: glutamate 5-kinase, partial [Clostridiales bacterium]|nr:glutamate 5-kinase [Clostridiales bacterium]